MRVAPRIFMVAAEASGDTLSREVIDAIRALQPDAVFAGIGGEQSAQAGIVSPIDISPLSIVGLFEALKIYDKVVELLDAATEAILDFKPDVVVLIDSWGFMLRLAWRIRAKAPQVKLIKLVGPQVWAMRPGRAKVLAATVDHLICIHAMEVPYYQGLGLPVTVMGNPALSRTTPGDGAAYRTSVGMAPDADMLLVLPGSRPSEIRKVAPDLVKAARLIKAQRPGVEVVFAPAPSVSRVFRERFPDLDLWSRHVVGDDARRDAMAAADLALACSGTVTSELAVQGTPFLVGYRTGYITWIIARYFLFRKRHITLLNIAADDSDVVREFLQYQLRSASVAKAALALLDDRQALDRQRKAQNAALVRMGEGDGKAAEIAAAAILKIVSAA